MPRGAFTTFEDLISAIRVFIKAATNVSSLYLEQYRPAVATW